MTFCHVLRLFVQCYISTKHKLFLNPPSMKTQNHLLFVVVLGDQLWFHKNIVKGVSTSPQHVLANWMRVYTFHKISLSVYFSFLHRSLATPIWSLPSGWHIIYFNIAVRKESVFLAVVWCNHRGDNSYLG